MDLTVKLYYIKEKEHEIMMNLIRTVGTNKGQLLLLMLDFSIRINIKSAFRTTQTYKSN